LIEIAEQTGLVDVAFCVCTALDSVGVRAVLTGGSAATYYADSYQSLDLDFVITFSTPHAGPTDALSPLGFVYDGSQFVHERSRFTVDFPRGPLMIGYDPVSRWDTARRGGQILHVLTRTDCVRDRLAAFFHWNDRSSLATACDVASSGNIDMDAIRTWSGGEGAAEKFREFERVLRSRRP
jgi:hypothetical protein